MERVGYAQLPARLSHSCGFDPPVSLTRKNLVVVSYSHNDRPWLKRLRKNLRPYEREACLAVWDDSEIQAGDQWQAEIEQALSCARVAVLLVSTEFLASDFIHDEELPLLLTAADNGELTLVCVPISASAYEASPIKSYQWAGDPKRPLDQLSPALRKKALVEVAKTIVAATGAQELVIPHSSSTTRLGRPPGSSLELVGSDRTKKRAVGVPKEKTMPSGGASREPNTVLRASPETGELLPIPDLRSVLKHPSLARRSIEFAQPWTPKSEYELVQTIWSTFALEAPIAVEMVAKVASRFLTGVAHPWSFATLHEHGFRDEDIERLIGAGLLEHTTGQECAKILHARIFQWAIARGLMNAFQKNSLPDVDLAAQFVLCLDPPDGMRGRVGYVPMDLLWLASGPEMDSHAAPLLLEAFETKERAPFELLETLESRLHPGILQRLRSDDLTRSAEYGYLSVLERGEE